jgi:hypothetical protein
MELASEPEPLHFSSTEPKTSYNTQEGFSYVTDVTAIYTLDLKSKNRTKTQYDCYKIRFILYEMLSADISKVRMK